jgi:hypothetical protein
LGGLCLELARQAALGEGRRSARCGPSDYLSHRAHLAQGFWQQTEGGDPCPRKGFQIYFIYYLFIYRGFPLYLSCRAPVNAPIVNYVLIRDTILWYKDQDEDNNNNNRKKNNNDNTVVQ